MRPHNGRMDIPIAWPVKPMLAKAVDTIPAADAVAGGYAYEPKWDGFRCIVLHADDTIELGSRNQRPLTRYFPEVVENVRAAVPDGCAVDGELVVRRGERGAQHLDWDALSQRIHPAESRVARLAGETPAEFVAFDVLMVDGRDVTAEDFEKRRALLETLFERIPGGHGLHLTRTTRDAGTARQWFETFEGAGLDGVVAKPLADTYHPDKRAMLKIKHKRTAEAVVWGYRPHARGIGVGSLLLAMYDNEGDLVPVGGIGAFPDAVRRSLTDDLAPLVERDGSGAAVTGQGERSRFSSSKDASFVRLRPELVVEVAFDQLEGRRFRHAVTLLRWRPDRDPRSCRLSQVDAPASYDLAQVLD